VRIERHPAVIEDDLPGIYAHIARDNAAAAERVLDAVAETFAQIAVHPESGIFTRRAVRK
jgi:plasmid stabilization system protein ParE